MIRPGRFLTKNVTLLNLESISPSGIVYGKEWKDKLLSTRHKVLPGWYEPIHDKDRDEFRAFTIVDFWFEDNKMRGTVSAMRSSAGAWFYKALAKRQLLFFPVTHGDLIERTTYVDPTVSNIMGFDALLNQ